MKKIIIIVMVVLLCCMAACTSRVGSDSSTKGLTTNREYDVNLDIETEQNGTTFVYIPVTASSELDSSGLSQDTANTSEFNPVTSLQKAIESMVNKALGSATAKLDEAKQDIDKPTDNSQNPVVNNEAPTVTPTKEETPEKQTEEKEEEVSAEYETEFHHTQTGSSDGGKSLVLCPGQTMEFDSCSVGSVNIPRHKEDEGREIYWNQTKKPEGDIICKKDGKEYKYKATETWVDGDCSSTTNKISVELKYLEKHNRWYNWLSEANLTGEDFEGKTLTITFDDGHVMTVEDPENTYYDDSDYRYFGGVNQKDTNCGSGKCVASIFGPVGVEVNSATIEW